MQRGSAAGMQPGEPASRTVGLGAGRAVVPGYHVHAQHRRWGLGTIEGAFVGGDLGWWDAILLVHLSWLETRSLCPPPLKIPHRTGVKA